MKTVSYSVPSISCGHCVQRIERAVSQVSGIKSVKADAAAKKVEVSFDSPASEDQIKALLAELNYPAA